MTGLRREYGYIFTWGVEMKVPIKGAQRMLWNEDTLSDKSSSDKIFDGQNISSDKIFDTKPKFRQFCPIFT